MASVGSIFPTFSTRGQVKYLWWKNLPSGASSIFDNLQIVYKEHDI